MAEAVSSHEFLRQQGATFVVFHPCAEQLVLGLGCNEQPAVVPHCVAYRRKKPHDHSRSLTFTASTAWPHQRAHEALLQVQRLLHLPAPPKPWELQPQQGSQPLDPFPAAKAGLVSQKEVPEGSDGFSWLDDKQQERIQQQRLQARKEQQQQQRQQQQRNPAKQQQHEAALRLQPCFAGGQVPALWPPDVYDAYWLMTPDNHIAGLDTTPRHILLDRFEAVWGWALQQLGLPRGRCRHLSAVLAVPFDMTAAEVRLLADLLLDRLGFAALVAHLEPIAATFGNGTTSACVVSIGSSSSCVCCVDDAVVLPPLASRVSVPVGLVDIAGALTGWMAAYSHWPQQLQQHGIGAGRQAASGASCKRGESDAGAAGATAVAAAAASVVPAAAGSNSWASCYAGAVSPADVYQMLLMEDLVLQQCYFPKENYQPGLLGQPMLEDQPPAVVPVRVPGQHTTNCQVSLGSWAAAAAMALFFPAIAPTRQMPLPPGASPPSAQQRSTDALQQAAVKLEAAAAADSGSVAGAQQLQTAAGPDAEDAAAAAVAGQLYCRHHAAVLDLPAAEALHLQSQLKARLEAGETGPPPDGMYLLPLELVDKPVGSNAAAGAGAGGPGTPGDSGARPVPVGSSSGPGLGLEQKGARTAGAGVRPAGGGSSIGLDEAVFDSIMASSRGRPELMARLAAGLLLVGPGGGLRGLASMLERRVGQRLAAAGQAQIVSCLEPRAEPAHVAWKGAALLAALDAGRENWLPRHQWVGGGMVLPAPAAAQGPGGGGSSGGAPAAGAAQAGKKAAGSGPAEAAGGAGGAGSGSNSVAAAGRHTKLFYYCRAEQGML